MGNYDFTIYQGATWRRTLTVKDHDTGVVINLTGCSAEMQIRQNYGDAHPLVSLTSEPTGGIVITGATGTIDITIPASTTTALNFKTAYADFMLTWPNADRTIDMLFYSTVKLKLAATQ